MNQNNEPLKKEETNELEVIYKIDKNEVKLTPSIVQKYLVGSNNTPITIQEFKFFTELCKVRKLNPFLKVTLNQVVINLLKS